MTTITYTEKNTLLDALTVKISLDGHADYDPGNDPVCAGISTITYQLLNTLSLYEDRGWISDLEAEVSPGHTVMVFTVKYKDRWAKAWEIIKIGYQNIADGYPNNVFIE